MNKPRVQKTKRNRRGRAGKTLTRTKPLPPVFTGGETLDMLNANNEVVGHANVFVHHDGKYPTTLHGYRIADLQKKAQSGQHYVVICPKDISPSHKTVKYPYHMKGLDIPSTLEDMSKSSYYIWDAHRLRKAAGPSPGVGLQNDGNSGIQQLSSATPFVRLKKNKKQDDRNASTSPAKTSSLTTNAAPAPKLRSLPVTPTKKPFQAAESQRGEIVATSPTPVMKFPPPATGPLRKQIPPPKNPFFEQPKSTIPQPSRKSSYTHIATLNKSPTTAQPTSKTPSEATAAPPPLTKPKPVDGPSKPSSTPQPANTQSSAPKCSLRPAPTLQPVLGTIPAASSTLETSAVIPTPGKDADVMDIQKPASSNDIVETAATDDDTTRSGDKQPGVHGCGKPSVVPQIHRPEDDFVKGRLNAVPRGVDRARSTSSVENDSQVQTDIDNGAFTDEEQDRLPSMVEDEAHIFGEEDEEQEDEGDEIKVPDTNGRGTYEKRRIRVRIDQLVFPPNLTRDLDMCHVGKLKTSLREGIEYSLGHISVCHKPSVKEFTPVRYDENKFRDVDVDETPINREIGGLEQLSLRAYFVANGMHRSTATDRIFREAKNIEDRQEFGVIYVILYSRKDGREMSFYELLALGGAANDIGTIAKPPTFADQVYLCVSCLKEILELNPDINITPVGLGKKFREHSIVRATSNGTHTKYARVTLTFVRHPKVYHRFLEYWRSGKAGQKFRVSHFQTKAFHTLFTEPEQLLILEALSDFLRHTNQSYFTSPAATAFYAECRQLLSIVREFADRMKLSTEEMLCEQVAITKQNSISVSRFFIRTVTCFLPTDKQANMSKKSALRVKRFCKTLLDNFFPKTEEEKRKEAEESELERQRKARVAAKRSHLSRIAKTNAISASNAMADSLKTSSTSKFTGKRKRQQKGDASVKVSRASVGLPRFDDSVPGRYPSNYASRPPKWIGTKDWVLLVDVAPHHIWGQHMCVMYPEPWLHGLGVPRKHRAHLFLSSADLERNHHAVYYHAGLQAALQPSITKNKLYGSLQEGKEDEGTRALQIANLYPVLSQVYLASCRQEVMKTGFCVVQGIFDDTGIRPGPVKTVYDENPASRVAEYYLKQFPAVEDIRNKWVKNTFWEPACNGPKEEQDDTKGRFVTSTEGLYSGTENAENTVEIARYRSALEVRALQLCVAMGLEETGKGMLAIPCTGSRMFTMTANSGRQVPHTDFDTKAELRETFCPSDTVGFSVMWTAEDPFPILLWEYSHVLQSGTQTASRKIASTAHAQRITIPPFSCIILRGDTFYAASGWQDQVFVGKRVHTQPVRFHMYVCRWGLEKVDRNERVTDAPLVPGSIHVTDKFQPHVQLNPSWLKKATDQN